MIQITDYGMSVPSGVNRKYASTYLIPTSAPLWFPQLSRTKQKKEFAVRQNVWTVTKRDLLSLTDYFLLCGGSQSVASNASVVIAVVVNVGKRTNLPTSTHNDRTMYLLRYCILFLSRSYLWIRVGFLYFQHQAVELKIKKIIHKNTVLFLPFCRTQCWLIKGIALIVFKYVYVLHVDKPKINT